MRVAELMTETVTAIAPDAPLRRAAELMVGARVSGLPVVDEDRRLVGIITEGDFLRREAGRSPWSEDQAADGILVRDVMTPGAITITPDQQLAEAARLMRRHGVKRLPVVDPKGRLVGMVTRADVLVSFLRPAHDVREEVESELIGRLLTLGPDRVRVEVRDGIVTLEGTLPTRFDAEVLLRMTRRVDGVIGIVDRLRWGSPWG